MSFIGPIIAAGVNALKNPSAAGSSAVTHDEIVNFVVDTEFAIQTVDDTFRNADRLMQDAKSRAEAIGKDVEQIATNLRDITNHTYNVALPNSLGWLSGYIYTHQVKPVKQAVDQLTSRVVNLENWRKSIDQWRRDTVDPTLADWRAFKRFFDTWPTDVLNTVHGWLQHPVQFSDFATPLIARPLLNYLSDESHKVLRDQFTVLMASAWLDQPNTIWDDLLTLAAT